MFITADPDGVRPLCKCCGKPLRKRSKLIYIETKREANHRDGEFTGYAYVEPGNEPTSRAECERLTNYPVLSFRRGSETGRFRAFTVWVDGQYVVQWGHFCTNDCAAAFGKLAADLERVKTTAYAAAVLKQRDDR